MSRFKKIVIHGYKLQVMLIYDEPLWSGHWPVPRQGVEVYRDSTVQVSKRTFFG